MELIVDDKNNKNSTKNIFITMNPPMKECERDSCSSSLSHFQSFHSSRNIQSSSTRRRIVSNLHFQKHTSPLCLSKTLFLVLLLLLSAVLVMSILFLFLSKSHQPISSSMNLLNTLTSSHLNTSSFSPHRILVSQQEQQQQHKKTSSSSFSLFPLDTSDYVGFFFAFLGLFLAAGGGIGGGGILVPIYILVLHFRPKYAIPLSNTTVLGGSIANTWINISKRHPYANRPLIDWDFILLTEPLTIAGALAGALLNKLLPEDKVVILLVLLLAFIAYTTFSKAFSMYHKESLVIQKQKQSILQQMIQQEEDELEEEEMIELIQRYPTNTMSLSILQQQQHPEEEDIRIVSTVEEGGGEENEENKSNYSLQDDPGLDISKSAASQDNTFLSSSTTTTTITSSPLLQTPTTFSTTTTHTIRDEKEQQRIKILQEEQHVPMNNLKILIILFLVVFIMNIVKGGSTGSFPSPLGITCGSSLFWFANLLMLFFIIYITFISRLYLLNQFQKKQACDYTYVEGDIIWDSKTTLVYPCICCMAGFFSGMFGIGGGIVFGPLMLALGIPPEVSSATSACMILFTSFTATTSFLVFGLLIYDYAIFCFVLGFLSTWIGQKVLSYLMKKSQRKSYIAFLIGGVVLVSAFLMTIQSVISMAEKSTKDGNVGTDTKGMGGICS